MPDDIKPSFNAKTRLAVYGTLAPGRENAHELSALAGQWRKGHVTGQLVKKGWGADLGYPALIPDAEGERIEVMVLESYDLPEHWDRLDAFEGDGYQRVVLAVGCGGEVIEASIYIDASA